MFTLACFVVVPTFIKTEVVLKYVWHAFIIMINIMHEFQYF